MPVPSPTPASAIYGGALAVLVGSHAWTYKILELFIAPGWTLGTHEQDWTAWHAMGCAYLGLTNALCWRDGDWNASARRALMGPRPACRAGCVPRQPSGRTPRGQR